MTPGRAYRNVFPGCYTYELSTMSIKQGRTVQRGPSIGPVMSAKHAISESLPCKPPAIYPS